MSDWDDSTRRSRAELIQSAFNWSSIDFVAEAVSEATEFPHRIYVERRGNRYRWSLAHPGGPYPLLRITAQYLNIDYTTLIVGCRAIEGGLSVLFDDRADQALPESWAVLQVSSRTDADEVSKRMRNALDESGSRDGEATGGNPLLGN